MWKLRKAIFSVSVKLLILLEFTFLPRSKISLTCKLTIMNDAMPTSIVWLRLEQIWYMKTMKERGYFQITFPSTFR